MNLHLMTHLFIHIKQLAGILDKPVSMLSGGAMQNYTVIEDAFLLVENGLIADYGTMDELAQKKLPTQVTTHNLTGEAVLPAWCDSHTHIVYAGNREQEFVDRINGLTYEQIAQKGGGILNSAKKLQKTSENELFEQSAQRLEEVMQLGTGAIEIKSGYGLTLEAEMKMLRVIQKLKEKYPISIKSTFLGAHAFPEEFKQNHRGYLSLLIEEMIPAIAAEKLADYLDVFCETGYFSVEETIELMEAGAKFGLKPKIHVNQFTAIGGVEAAVKHRALSVDHLEILTDDDVKALQNSATMPVALPSCSFFLSIPYTPTRKLIDSGLPVALASDYNPGTTPSGNMNFVVATACIKMKMTPEEAFNAATINGAYAMDLADSHGSITVGKKACLIITKKIPSYSFIPYSFGNNLIERVMINGQFV